MERLARWCTRGRFAVLAIWLVALGGLLFGVVRAGGAFTDSTTLPHSESGTAYDLLAKIGAESPSTETGTIAWRTSGTSVSDAAVQQRVAATLQRVEGLRGVEAVVSPYTSTGASQLSSAADTAYATVTVDEDTYDADAVIAAADTLDGAGIHVYTGGTAFTEQPGASHVTELVGLLAALLVLFLVFRSGWAAALPVVTGVVGVAASLLIVVLASHAVDLASTSLTMGALIGLGVGIDYALFIVNRHRAALMDGASVPQAVARALGTSGRAVVFAGATVVVALLGMFVVDLDILTGMSRAAAVTVLCTVAAALTLLPALLAVLGHRVLSRRQRAALRARAGSSPAAAPVGSRAARAPLAGRWAALVQGAPRRMVALALLVVIVIAAPVARLRVGDADASSDPAGSSTKAYDDVMSSAFGKGFDATLVMVGTTPDDASRRAFSTMVADLSAVKGVASVSAAPVSSGQSTAVATVVPTTSAQAEATSTLVHTLREDVVPTAERGSQLHVYVGGTTATSIDLSDALISKLPYYLALIAVLGFLLLAVAFRSVLVPLVGALTNLVTIAVGLGAVTAIFQFGWGTHLLGVGTAAPVTYLVPVLVVGIMFGLSMDYQVFLVSRMHEEWTHTRDHARAVRVGLRETALVIAAAATIMLSVFASFGFSGQRIISMIGIGLALGILVDAFVVRLTLVPALMTLVGRRTWAYPRWAERITPRLSIEGPAPAPVVATAPEEPVREPQPAR